MNAQNPPGPHSCHRACSQAHDPTKSQRSEMSVRWPGLFLVDHPAMLGSEQSMSPTAQGKGRFSAPSYGSALARCLEYSVHTIHLMKQMEIDL